MRDGDFLSEDDDDEEDNKNYNSNKNNDDKDDHEGNHYDNPKDIQKEENNLFVSLFKGGIFGIAANICPP